MATVDSIVSKLNTFKSSLSSIKTALSSKGVSVSGSLKASDVASKISSISTSRNMGSKSVTFKQNTIVYGIKITESESEPTNRVTYIENAQGMTPISVTTNSGSLNQWVNSWIFQKVYPVMLKTNGTLDYKLNTSNQTLKATGGTSDIANTNYNGNAMVCIEKFYTKFSMNGENEEIRISNTKQTGYEAIGFIREDGTEADRIYLPMYMGSNIDGKLRSLSGQRIDFGKSYLDNVSAAEANGSGYGIESYAMDLAFQTLITILIKSFNYSEKLGTGRKDDVSTGKLNDKGAFAFESSKTFVSKALWVEDFTTYSQNTGGNFPQRYESGLISNNSKVYIRMQPPYTYNAGATTGYTQITDYVQSNLGGTSACKCSNAYGRIPIKYGAAFGTHDCSAWYTNQDRNSRVSQRGSNYGIWGRMLNVTGSNKAYATWVGAGLTYLPPK